MSLTEWQRGIKIAWEGFLAKATACRIGNPVIKVEKIAQDIVTNV
jgi:hypothetical protein